MGHTLIFIYEHYVVLLFLWVFASYAAVSCCLSVAIKNNFYSKDRVDLFYYASNLTIVFMTAWVISDAQFGRISLSMAELYEGEATKLSTTIQLATAELLRAEQQKFEIGSEQAAVLRSLKDQSNYMITKVDCARVLSTTLYSSNAFAAHADPDKIITREQDKRLCNDFYSFAYEVDEFLRPGGISYKRAQELENDISSKLGHTRGLLGNRWFPGLPSVLRSIEEARKQIDEESRRIMRLKQDLSDTAELQKEYLQKKTVLINSPSVEELWKFLAIPPFGILSLSIRINNLFAAKSTKLWRQMLRLFGR